MAEHTEVVVVGAGLAGLACATRLARAGLDVHVLEAGDAVGGRVRTDVVDGFVIDRGFQVFNTAYPEARRVLDLEALDLRAFDRAAEIHHEGRTTRLAEPWREPGTLLGAVRGPFGGPRERAALVAYAGRTVATPAARVRRRRDVPAAQAWADAGLGHAVQQHLLRPFFAGVLLEQEMSTSRRFVDLMTRMFALGRAAVPARGMQQIPEQLAGWLPEGRVHLGVSVDAVAPGRVTTGTDTWSASAVVVATDGDAAAGLLGGAVPPPRWHGVTTVYHAAPTPPGPHATLRLDADPGPVVNTVVLTNAAPTYAADGRALVATSVLHRPGARVDEPALRRRLEELWGTSTAAWSVVAVREVPQALPAMPAPHRFRKPVRVATGDDVVHVCGDHRDTSSIQGALVSGRRAADAVLADRNA